MQNKQLDARSHISSYIVLCWVPIVILTFFIGTALIGRWDDINADDESLFRGYLCGCLLFGSISIWLKGLRIIVTNDSLIFRNGFWLTSKVLLKDIGFARIQTTSLGLHDRGKVYHLFVKRLDGEKDLLINIKPFSREDLSTLFELLDVKGKIKGLKTRKNKARRKEESRSE